MHTVRYRNRREFLRNVGQGMIVAGIGGLAHELGVPRVLADSPSERLAFGSWEPLVEFLQNTPVEKLLPALADKLKQGESLRSLTAAAALANARRFGGEDYIGFHTMMALAPAWHMSQELPSGSSALPVFKVLYRNSARIQAAGGPEPDTLHPVAPATGPADGRTLRDAVRGLDRDGAESQLAALTQGAPLAAFNQLLEMVEDNTEVHRVVLPYRAWALLDLVGPEHAHTMLRQSIRYCLQNEPRGDRAPRGVLAKVFDQFHLESLSLGTRSAEDAWVEAMCQTLIGASPEQAAEAVAAALAEGMAPTAVGEAISMCANQIVLRDAGRSGRQISDGKPAGSVHGDSLGVHASDAVNAWRNIGAVSEPRHTAAGLVLAGYEVARDSKHWGQDLSASPSRPFGEDLERVTATDPQTLLTDLDGAIRENAQAMACAITHRYGEQGHNPRAVFDALLKYAVSEDGALHAEKYYHTVSEEFARTRPAFRWRQLVALARVTASEYGRPAPGYEEARGLLGAS